LLRRYVNRALNRFGYQLSRLQPAPGPHAPQAEDFSAPAPSAPAGFDPASFFDPALCWHLRWEVFRGVFTPGANDVARMLSLAGLPRDLRGSRVLDVGTMSGGCAFECERRGAEVVAIDLMSPDETGFNRLKELLSSRVEFRRRSVYDLSPSELGTFDVILFLGVLYHLRYPTVGVDNLRRVSRPGTRVFIESHVHSFDPEEPPAWRFFPGGELNDDPSNWFSPNPAAVLTAFETLGYETELVGTTPQSRGLFRATLTRERPPFLETSGEGGYYDLSMRPLFGEDLRAG
jgi:tRNA (mo5U34)-methyltransferase